MLPCFPQFYGFPFVFFGTYLHCVWGSSRDQTQGSLPPLNSHPGPSTTLLCWKHIFLVLGSCQPDMPQSTVYPALDPEASYGGEEECLRNVSERSPFQFQVPRPAPEAGRRKLSSQHLSQKVCFATPRLLNTLRAGCFPSLCCLQPSLPGHRRTMLGASSEQTASNMEGVGVTDPHVQA